jgi:hypothetical protein
MVSVCGKWRAGADAVEVLRHDRNPTPQIKGDSGLWLPGARSPRWPRTVLRSFWPPPGGFARDQWSPSVRRRRNVRRPSVGLLSSSAPRQSNDRFQSPSDTCSEARDGACGQALNRPQEQPSLRASRRSTALARRLLQCRVCFATIFAVSEWVVKGPSYWLLGLRLPMHLSVTCRQGAEDRSRPNGENLKFAH